MSGGYKNSWSNYLRSTIQTMSDKRKKRSLIREGEPSEKTEKGLEVPIPTRGDFFDNLKKAAKAPLTARRRPKQ